MVSIVSHMYFKALLSQWNYGEWPMTGASL